MQLQATHGACPAAGTSGANGMTPANQQAEPYPSPAMAWYCVLVIALTRLNCVRLKA